MDFFHPQNPAFPNPGLTRTPNPSLTAPAPKPHPQRRRRADDGRRMAGSGGGAPPAGPPRHERNRCRTISLHNADAVYLNQRAPARVPAGDPASADLDHPSGSSPAPPAVPARLLGCDPMKVANALFTHCRGAPGPEAILNERCCVTVVSTVARPSCFCLVQKESAFVMSAVHNKSSMGNLLQRCGAPADLMRIVDDPCGDTAHTVDDRSCAVSMKASTSCLSWKITAIVALTVVCVLVLVAPALYLWLWRQAPARRARM